MAAIIPRGGVNERERTTIPDEAVSDCDGAEYRIGENGLFVARGRALGTSVSGVTWRGAYEAGFDLGDRLIGQERDNLYASPIGVTLGFTLFDSLPSGSSQIMGSHFAGKHYVASGVANRRLEYTVAGVTSFPIGMSRSTLTVGLSVTQAAGAMAATIGLVYWLTEYDSVRGIESMAGVSVSSGPISDKDSVIGTISGVSANPRADQIRVYRSVDAGGWPDGGLLTTIPIGTTTFTDTNSGTGILPVPLYGIVSVGGNDTERDAPPPVMTTIFGPFGDSLLGVPADDERLLQFTPAGFPDSWPPAYAAPFQAEHNDRIVGGAVLTGRIGVFCSDSVHVVYRLPRDSDSIFAAGEAQDLVTDEHGLVSRRGVVAFSPLRQPRMVAWVCDCGIWITDLTEGGINPVTDKIAWASRVNVARLEECELKDDPGNRRLIFRYVRTTDTTYGTGLWYIDYQEFDSMGLRVTFADHGPLAAVERVKIAGAKRMVSFDSRPGNGNVYVESTQDVDDSHLRDSSGSVRFRMRLKEFLPAGARDTAHLGEATWMHDAGPPRIEHRFYSDRDDDNPDINVLPNPTERNADSVGLGTSVNGVSLEIESTGTVSYGVHWIDIEGLDIAKLAGRKGA